MMGELKQLEYVLMYDGDCLFCNASVRSIVRRLKKTRMAIIPLQSATAKKLLDERFKGQPVPDSNILLTRDQTFVKSTGSLKLFKHFAWYWQPFRIFEWIPRAFRDWVYDLIATNRHRLAKKNMCMLNPQDNRDTVEIFDEREAVIETVYRAFTSK